MQENSSLAGGQNTSKEDREQRVYLKHYRIEERVGLRNVEAAIYVSIAGRRVYKGMRRQQSM
jgi:hypothetical protein